MYVYMFVRNYLTIGRNDFYAVFLKKMMLKTAF